MERLEDKEDELLVTSTDSRVLRGGSFCDPASHVRSAYRDLTVPTYRDLHARFSSGEDFTAWLLYCFTTYRRRRSKMKRGLIHLPEG